MHVHMYVMYTCSVHIPYVIVGTSLCTFSQLTTGFVPGQCLHIITGWEREKDEGG